MSIYIKKSLQLLILSVIFLTALSVPAGIVDTKHNLAHWGPGTFKAVSEDRVCIFCHTPHNASPDGPLWSHDLSVATTFKKYSSKTLRILGPAQLSSGYLISGGADTITGATKLCLGCHDGLTALGAITTGGGSRTIEMVGADTLGAPSDETGGYAEGAGTVNIQNKHPVSFNYNATVVSAINNAVTPPAEKGAVYGLPGITNDNGTSANTAVEEMVRRAGGRIECTICHDPHTNRATTNYTSVLPFWISSSVDDATLGDLDSYEAVCASCHSQSFGEYTVFEEYTSYR